MQRRKFLAAMGSVAAAGAAATGTGAFTSTSASRNVSVNVADDSSAFLTLKKTTDNENRAYADGSGDEITVDLSDTANPDGTGVNKDAVTQIFDIFSIQNQGTQDVIAYVPPRSLDDDSAFDISANGVYLDPQVSGMPNGRGSPVLGTLPDGTKFTSLTGIGGSVLSSPGDFETDLFESNSNIPAGPAVYLLEPGQSFDFGLYIKTNDSANLTNLDYSMKIRASSSLADKARNQGYAGF